jgi:hypothetical protein
MWVSTRKRKRKMRRSCRREGKNAESAMLSRKASATAELLADTPMASRSVCCVGVDKANSIICFSKIV